MAADRLAALLDWDVIVELAGSLYLQRGMFYLEDGRVGPVSETDGAIEAKETAEKAGVRLERPASRNADPKFVAAVAAAAAARRPGERPAATMRSTPARRRHMITLRPIVPAP